MHSQHVQPSEISTHFGGPDLTKNQLRDVLLTSIQQSPTGSDIKWLCYYLADQLIVNALIEASKRLVNVTLLIDKNPRSPQINQTAIQQLSNHSSSTLKLVLLEKIPFWHYLGIHWHAHFHSKCYYFSHPVPHAFIGSYNPTTASPELSAELVQKIGDHTISHNVLVTIKEPDLLSVLLENIDHMQKRGYINKARTMPTQNRSFTKGEWQIDFLPRKVIHPINKLLLSGRTPAKVKCAISHLKGPTINHLITQANKQHSIELLLECSERRVPKKNLQSLHKNKITTYQPPQPENCLMHNKFILFDDGRVQKVMFGSFNWSTRSTLLNHEIIVTTSCKEIYADFYARWEVMTGKPHQNVQA